MIKEALEHKINLKTKPIGSLGSLEKIALKIGEIQNTLSPVLHNPSILVFAADHGIAKDGVSAYPQEVTYQMVMNFIQGGAAINVFCKQNNIALKIIDAGVNYTFEDLSNLINLKVGLGTKSFLQEKAMSALELGLCFENGKETIRVLKREGCNIVGFGEMGIGNTSSASMLMSSICEIPIDQCIGRGTGINDQQLFNKLSILTQAQKKHGKLSSPEEILCTFGGFEIAQICGAMLEAYDQKMVLLVDGFIASAAFLVAFKINPAIIDNALFCHLSEESGHEKLLNYINAEPILKLNMRLGEGTGCAVAYPIIKSAVAFLNEMASFDSAGVSTKN